MITAITWQNSIDRLSIIYVLTIQLDRNFIVGGRNNDKSSQSPFLYLDSSTTHLSNFEILTQPQQACLAKHNLIKPQPKHLTNGQP